MHNIAVYYFFGGMLKHPTVPVAVQPREDISVLRSTRNRFIMKREGGSCCKRTCLLFLFPLKLLPCSLPRARASQRARRSVNVFLFRVHLLMHADTTLALTVFLEELETLRDSDQCATPAGPRCPQGFHALRHVQT